MLKVSCTVQNYAWGKKGCSSSAARFKKAMCTDFKINESDSYAELWMGTHLSGPTTVLKTNELLSDFLQQHPSCVGQVPAGYPTNNLPFLFKVLSVRTALSIQTHPDKSVARELHEKFPDIYKDGNHKPEMVIALTDFECMCGFRSVAEIMENLKLFPELVDVIDYNAPVTEQLKTSMLEDSLNIEAQAVTLRTMFECLMECPAETVRTNLRAMISRLAQVCEEGKSTALDALMVRLNEQYPDDIGVFSPILMNYICLKPGDSFFIGANELHAYLAGECIECMALSDNVVRAGLTPKFKDSTTLSRILNYKSQYPNFLVPEALDCFTSVYRPPVDSCSEFEVDRIIVPPNTMGYCPPVVPCGSMLLMVEANSNNNSTNICSTEELCTVSSSSGVDDDNVEIISMQVGMVAFVPAGISFSISTTADNSAVFYRAHVNLGGDG